MTEPIAYLDGRYVPISQALLHVFDLGLVGGASVSEMVRTFRHVPFRLDEHLARLERSLGIVGFEPELTMAELKVICERVVSENAELIPAHHDLGLTVFVTAGNNLTYLGRAGADLAQKSTVCVHTFPLPFELWASRYETGLHLVTVGTRSIPNDVFDARIKHRSRLHWHLADRQARQIDPSAMAVLENDDGDLTETATGNVCVVEGSTIVTPAVGVLEGISRDFVAELAGALNVTLVHARVGPDELMLASEAFVTSTPHCLLPVTKFNDQPVGNGRPGPIYQQLLEAWSQAVGVNIVEQMRHGARDRESTS
jgi:branched-chain amino acid aminotransferase